MQSTQEPPPRLAPSSWATLAGLLLADLAPTWSQRAMVEHLSEDFGDLPRRDRIALLQRMLEALGVGGPSSASGEAAMT